MKWPWRIFCCHGRASRSLLRGNVTRIHINISGSIHNMSCYFDSSGYCHYNKIIGVATILSFSVYLNKMATWSTGRTIQEAVLETCLLTAQWTPVKYEPRMWVSERKYDEFNKKAMLLPQQFPYWDPVRITLRKYYVTWHNKNSVFTVRKNNYNNKEYEIVQTKFLKAKKKRISLINVESLFHENVKTNILSEMQLGKGTFCSVWKIKLKRHRCCCIISIQQTKYSPFHIACIYSFEVA
jgi:hypothetical protein